jgi:formylglycine-generating enzyme required for sulfatase activity
MSLQRKSTTATGSGWPGCIPERVLFGIAVGCLLAGLFVGAAGAARATAMVEIPAGPLIVGDDAAGESHRLTLPAFYIDRDEVSNDEFAGQFPAHAFPAGAGGHPASGMTWDEARRFCATLDKRLPRADEWEKAARGGDGRLYPWGDRHPRKTFHPFFSGVVKRRPGLDRRDVSVYGPRGMAGSLWEWTDEGRGGRKAARGGLWNLHLDYEYSKTFDRIFIAPESRFVFLGFRCARSAE